MQKLASLSLENFRSCQSTRLTLADFTPLVGRNNVGKTNILNGIVWLLRWSSLGVRDYFDRDKRVCVSGVIEGIDATVLSGILSKHSKQIGPYVSPAGTLGIRRIQDAPDATKSDAKLEVRDPKVTKGDDPKAWVPNPTGISQALETLFPDPIFIGAMENVPDDVAKNKSSSTLGKLIKPITESLLAQHKGDLDNALQVVKNSLSAEGTSRSQILTTMDASATKLLNDFYPGLDVRIHIPPPELKAILADGTVQVQEKGSLAWRAVADMGHGAQRSIQMALIRQLAEVNSTAKASETRTLLLVDEPEIYQHPQGVELVRLALKELSRDAYQVVFATHSPIMVRRDDAHNAAIVRKEGMSTTVASTVASAIRKVVKDNTAQASLLFELDNSSEMLFSDQVIFVEGSSERILLPEIFCAIKGCTLLRGMLGLVDVASSSNLPGALEVAQEMGIKAKAVADLDYAFRVAVRAGIIPSTAQELADARKWFASEGAALGMTRDTDGFPCKGNGMTSAECFAKFASSADGQVIAASLHNKLLPHDTWLWCNGCFEDHLDNFRGKNEDALRELARQIRNDGAKALGSALDPMTDLVNWLVT